MKQTNDLKRFNPYQAHALDSRRNLVVRANAGSGKTSVLLQRIIQLLARGTGLKINGLAAVTFTRKAAAQLREKLTEAFAGLTDQANSADERQFWREQIELLPRASIGTIDSFCARILREHGLTGNDPIDPGFTLMSDHEHAALRRQAVERLINRLGAPADRLNDQDKRHQEDMLWWAREEGYFSLSNRLVELLGHGVEPSVIIAAHRDPRPIEQRIDEAHSRLPHKVKLQRDRAVLREQLRALQIAIDESNSSTKTLTTLAETLPAILEDLRNTNVESDERVFAWLVEHLTVNNGKSPRKQGLTSIIEFAQPIQDDWVTSLRDADFDRPAEARALEAADRLARLLEPAYAEYLALCRDTGQYDFDTVARRTRDLLADHEHVRAELKRRFRYILVDEFQDTNQLQWEVISYLVGEGPQGPLDRDRLFIVGDPQQSIYRFRQADVSVFERLQGLIIQSNFAHGSANVPTDYDDHAGASSEPDQRLGFMRLPVNYRTLSPMPLQLVNRVMKHTFGEAEDLPFEVTYQDLESDGSAVDGGEIRYVTPDGQAEAAVEAVEDTGGDTGSDIPREIPLNEIQVQCVVDQLIRLHGQPRLRPGENESHTLEFRDMAILLPSRDVVLANLEKELAKRNVPFIVTKGVGFWQRQEVRDLVSLASVLADPGDDMSLFAVLRGPIGRLTDTEVFFLSQLGRGKLNRGLGLAARSADDLSLFEQNVVAGDAGSVARASGFGDAGSVAHDRADASNLRHIHPPDMFDALRDAWRCFGDRRQRLRQVHEQLKGWRTRVERMAHSDLLQRSLEESDALAVYAAEPGGEQILANLRKLFQLIRAEDGRNSPGMVRLGRWLREQVDVSLREEQAALPEDRDAVRIMTIHAAKGLEFPVVAVMKMERKVRGSNSLRMLVKSPEDKLLPADAAEFAGIPAGRLALAVQHPERPRENYPSRLLLALRRLDCAQELAERRRLFYVAATRAKERLILAGSQVRKNESWQTWFEKALGIEPAHKEGGAWEVDVQRVTIITEPEIVPPLPPSPLAELTDDISLAPIREAPKEPMLATTSLDKMLQAWRDNPRNAWLAHQVQVAPHLPALPEHFPEDAPDSLKERVSTSIGTLVHRLFEMREVLQESPQERRDFLRAMAANLLAGTSGEVGFENEAEATPAAVERVVAGVEGILKKLKAPSEQATAVRRLLEADGEAEADFALQVDRWHISGRYDKLIRLPGGYEIVDWKSDADPSADVIADRHRPQMRLYALALHRAGRHILVDGAIRVHLAMLHFPLVQTLRFTVDELEAHAAHLAGELNELAKFSPGIAAAW